jgi:hypothetical protein
MELIIASFNLFFLSEIDADYGDVLHHAEVRWISRGTVLKRVLALRLEIYIFINKKWKIVCLIAQGRSAINDFYYPRIFNNMLSPVFEKWVRS